MANPCSLAAHPAVHRDSDIQLLRGGFRRGGNNDLSSTCRYGASVHIFGCRAIAVVEVVYVVLVDVDAVAATLLSMRDQRPAIAGRELEVDLDLE